MPCSGRVFLHQLRRHYQSGTLFSHYRIQDGLSSAVTMFQECSTLHSLPYLGLFPWRRQAYHNAYAALPNKYMNSSPTTILHSLESLRGASARTWLSMRIWSSLPPFSQYRPLVLSPIAVLTGPPRLAPTHKRTTLDDSTAEKCKEDTRFIDRDVPMSLVYVFAKCPPRGWLGRYLPKSVPM
jgi:hypothetical protein